MDFVLPGEAFNGIHLVLLDAPIKMAGNTDVKGACAADQDIDPELVMETIAHGGRC